MEYINGYLNSLVSGYSNKYEKYRNIHYALRALGVRVDFDLDNNIAIAYFNKDSQEFKDVGYTPYSREDMKIIEQCNGLVFHIADNGRVVVDVLPCKIVINYEKRYHNEIDANIKNGKYVVMPSIDGTNINLYYRNGRWIISTAKHYYMNKATWIGTSTYEDIIAKLLGLDNIQSIPWDKTTYYNLIFHYNEFHPSIITSTPDGIWNYNICGRKNLPSVPEYPTIEIDIAKHNSMYKLSQYFTGSTIVSNGFVLRSKDNVMFNTVILKTTAFLCTEKILYDFPLEVKYPLNNMTRPVYIAIRAYFNPEYKQHCEKYIPSYVKTYFANIETLVEKMKVAIANFEKIVVSAEKITYTPFQQYIRDTVILNYTTETAADIVDYIKNPKNHIHLVNLYQLLFSMDE